MKSVTKSFQIIYIASLLLCFSCSNPAPVKKQEEEKVIPMENVSVALPDGEGKDLVMGNCVPCHSLRYIEMQPNLTKANWEKIVKKMITAYHAPITDSLVAEKIVDYLYKIKGK